MGAVYTPADPAVELAGLHGKGTLLDAYCGVGTIGMIASRDADEVIGVELNPDAVKDAEANARAMEKRTIESDDIQEMKT